eukprot:CAMPEP_0203671900 /NCGR_PEP_ID=MMETSP0090-20130426/7569_1 /ASSEMBLY_ACC=CAM_ASM_001088 /TAXON_ID=426623 /ORGANISM="Chaetoceros affinis, Strain CCMP159" /LENGTH=342 /DNA_ID=CAMNT_0050537085 /DNA_START=104 /DNA_END=1129 /DNA_ORIENTATION=-
MQLPDDDMMDYDDRDSINQEDEEFLDDEEEEEADHHSSASESSEQKNNADDSSIWSFVPPSLNDEAAVEEHLSRDELTILPVDSTDSMPSQYGKAKEEGASNNNSIVLDMNHESSPSTTGNVEQILIPDSKAPTGINPESPVVEIKSTPRDQVPTVSSFLERIKNIGCEKAFSKLKDWRIVLFVLWVVTFMFALYYAQLSIEQSQELARLQQENDCLRRTISDLEGAKLTEPKGWFSQGSNMVKEWASSIADINISEYYTTSEDEESTYLDVWPSDAIDAVKNVSSTVAAIFSEVVDDVSTGTKDAFESMGETFSSVGENLYSVEEVSNTVSSMGETIIDIW